MNKPESRWVLTSVVLIPALIGCALLSLSRNTTHNTVQAQEKPSPTLPSDPFAANIKNLLNSHCSSCHNTKKQMGGVNFDSYKDALSAKKGRDIWEKVKEQLESKQMPPKGKPQPTDAEKKAILTWIEEVGTKIDCTLAKDPGRPTIRRLNRVEYNNTIRDLVAVNFKPADDFPTDDVGYGFDNIGDVLSMPPILLEKYLSAADKILESAIVIQTPIVKTKDIFRPQNVRSTLGPKSKEGKYVALTDNGAAIVSFDFLHDGEYIFRAKAFGDQAGSELPKLVIENDRKKIKEFSVEAVKKEPKYYECRQKVSAGRHDISFAFTNDFFDKNAPEGIPKDRNLFIELMEIEGPFDPVPKPLPESHKLIMIATPKDASENLVAARKIIANFASRAYRRPATNPEIDRLLKVFQFAENQKETFENSLKHALKAVLVSPQFLFRIEKNPETSTPGSVYLLNEFELASRLSYFLWSSMPDSTLIQLASNGELRKPGVIEAQIQRMLKDPKSSALVENFSGQWLMLRTLATLTPDRGTYRNYDQNLRSAMIRETELYFEHILREDRSIMEFLDSDYTFVNERLAKHYGIGGVSGSQFKKVSLTDKKRGGIVTQASVLTVTSNPTRTSPVKRGKWILENILGTPPPPAPPDVPLLEEDSKAVLSGSLRQRMEQHRKNPNCAVCHEKLDPLGFGLENFDGVGSFRTYDGKFKIDPSGVLPDGSKFNGPEDLKKVLLKKSDLFRRNLAEKMLTYALGRGLEYYDKCVIDDVTDHLKKNDEKFSAMIVAIIKSDAFQKRRTPQKSE